MNQSNLIPWRVRAFISSRFPLAYHLAINLGKAANSPDFWDDWLKQTWDETRRIWPTKNRLIQSLTRESDRILDLGCGNGGILRHLQEAGYRDLHGLELSRYAVDRLSKLGITMHSGKLPKISVPDSHFDVVIASQVLEHIIRRRTFVKEIRRVLRPGGKAFIFVPDNCLGPIDEENHVMQYTHDTLAGLLDRYFSVQRIESIRDANHDIPVLFALVSKPTE